MKGYICQLELATVDPPAPVKVRKLAKVLGLNKADLLLLAYVTKAPSEIRGILKRSVVGDAEGQGANDCHGDLEPL